MNSVDVKFIKLDQNAAVPSYGTSFSAGADLYALSDSSITIPAGGTQLIHTGIAIELPQGTVGLIYSRSGLATKRGLAPANKVGVIDSDYRGEIMVALHNHNSQPQTVEPGERIAQLVVMPYIKANFCHVDELDNTDRGAGGFGSTGRK